MNGKGTEFRIDDPSSAHDSLFQAIGVLDSETFVHLAKLCTLGELFSSLAHDVNNPLNGVMNCADILSSSIPEDDPRREFADLICKEAERISKLIRGVSEFARSTGSVKEIVRFEELWEITLPLINKYISKSNITLEVRLGEDLPHIHCCGYLLRQVLLGLLMSSAQATDERFPEPSPEKRIRFEAQRFDAGSATSLRLTVEDRGSPVPAPLPPTTFELMMPTEARIRSMIIPMAALPRLIATMKGSATVKSEPGGVTRWTLDLPGIPEAAS